MRTLIAAAAFALALTFPAFACDVTKQQVIDTLNANGMAFAEVPGDKLAEFAAMAAPMAGVKAEDVIGALIADLGGQGVYGLETKDGCFSPQPIPLPGQGAGVGA